jgi:hypothetical protein
MDMETRPRVVVAYLVRDGLLFFFFFVKESR